MINYRLSTFIFTLISLIAVVTIGLLFTGQPALSDIGNIAQIIEASIAIALLIIASDIRESTKARHLAGVRYVKELIGSEEASENRKWVHQDFDLAQQPLSDMDINRALRICRDFDHIGFLCRKGLIPTDLVTETYNRNIVEMWQKLESLINKRRTLQKDIDYFWEFEWLAKKSKKVKRKYDRKKR
jgi:hypothetical protein